MVDIRTIVTELITGLGTLGYDNVDDALAARPAQMVSVSAEHWQLLEVARRGGALNAQFEGSFANGRAMLQARDGLRGRIPNVIEWKGSQKNPGDNSLPIDLRIDHVYLISCKYDSHMLHNRAPVGVFDHALRTGAKTNVLDWYSEVAPFEYQALYEAAAGRVGQPLPATVSELNTEHRELLKSSLSEKVWPEELARAYEELCSSVARQSALRWKASVGSKQSQEEMLWRILRFGPAPYFILGNTSDGPMRLRIATPWDWRQLYSFRSLEITPMPGGQPMVSWKATVKDRHIGVNETIAGFVEIRWSHGRFRMPPEAKVKLMTPYNQVPGYFTLR